MKTVAAALADWLAENNLPSEGVALVVHLPTPRDRNSAEFILEHELRPGEAFEAPASGRLVTRLHGVQVRFEAKPWGHE